MRSMEHGDIVRGLHGGKKGACSQPRASALSNRFFPWLSMTGYRCVVCLAVAAVTVNAGEEKEVALENLASREPSTRVREAMSIQVLHCPYG